MAAALAVTVAGCSGRGDSEGGLTAQEAEVLRTVELANETFADGDYEATCSYYSAELQRELARDVGSCPAFWATIHRAMRRTLTDAQFDAFVSYDAETAKVHGDTAIARWGEPPPEVGELSGTVAGSQAELRKEDGRWVITTFPAVGTPEPRA